MSDKVDVCPYCGCSYPHQGPTGCLPLLKAGANRLWSNADPWIIWPYYIGRDKGPWHDTRGMIPSFFNEGRAWKYVFDFVQPGDERACDNYRIVKVSEYIAHVRGS